MGNIIIFFIIYDYQDYFYNLLIVSLFINDILFYILLLISLFIIIVIIYHYSYYLRLLLILSQILIKLLPNCNQEELDLSMLKGALDHYARQSI